MKIKLAILEKDTSYLNRLVSAFGTKYADKFEIYSFTDKAVAMDNIDKAKIDVFVAGSEFEIDTEILPRRCGFAYFVESIEIDTYKNQMAICKYQKADLIYKQILSIYSENAGNISGLKLGEDVSRVIFYTSVSGGTGSSSMAVATAMHYATVGHKVIYLNFEPFGSTDTYFSAEGQFDMSDVIFALKSKKTNLSLKLESCVKTDITGVNFYSQTKLALDMMELGSEEVIHLLSELQLTGSYDYIIVDMPFALEKNTLEVLKQAHSIVWVSDGSVESNTKIKRAFDSLVMKEQGTELDISERLRIVYNKFSNKTGRVIDEEMIRNVGGAPRFEHATTEQVVKQLSTMSFFEALIK
mgnify:CR=1 FL=1